MTKHRHKYEKKVRMIENYDHMYYMGTRYVLHDICMLCGKLKYSKATFNMDYKHLLCDLDELPKHLQKRLLEDGAVPY